MVFEASCGRWEIPAGALVTVFCVFFRDKDYGAFLIAMELFLLARRTVTCGLAFCSGEFLSSDWSFADVVLALTFWLCCRLSNEMRRCCDSVIFMAGVKTLLPPIENLLLMYCQSGRKIYLLLCH